MCSLVTVSGRRRRRRRRPPLVVFQEKSEDAAAPRLAVLPLCRVDGADAGGVPVPPASPSAASSTLAPSASSGARRSTIVPGDPLAAGRFTPKSGARPGAAGASTWAGPSGRGPSTMVYFARPGGSSGPLDPSISGADDTVSYGMLTGDLLLGLDSTLCAVVRGGPSLPPTSQPLFAAWAQQYKTWHGLTRCVGAMRGGF